MSWDFLKNAIRPTKRVSYITFKKVIKGSVIIMPVIIMKEEKNPSALI